MELNSDLDKGGWVFKRENEGMAGAGGHKYSQGNEKLQKAARGLGPCAGHLGLLTGTYLQRDWETGP